MPDLTRVRWENTTFGKVKIGERFRVYIIDQWEKMKKINDEWAVRTDKENYDRSVNARKLEEELPVEVEINEAEILLNRLQEAVEIL